MSKIDKLAQVPMTGSSAEFLAETYGQGSSVDEFAETLPAGAWVIDVAAGRSNFGAEIAARRPDITWHNFDIQYDSPVVQTLASEEKAPANLQFLKGNALTPFESAMHGRYDRAYSY